MIKRLVKIGIGVALGIGILFIGWGIFIASPWYPQTWYREETTSKEVMESNKKWVDKMKNEGEVKLGVQLEYVSVTTTRSINQNIECVGEVTYPQILSGADADIMNRINKKIEQTVKETFLHDDEKIYAPSVAEAVAAYAKQCSKELKERIALEIPTYKHPPYYHHSWFHILKTSVSLNEKNLLSLRFDLQNEFGGAHPIYWTSVLSFDVKTGKILTFDDLFKPDQLQNFFRYEKQALLDQNPFQRSLFSGFEEALKKNEPLIPGMHINTFYLTPKSMMSVYQDYEITGHGNGIPHVEMPYAKLRSFVYVDGPLGVFLDR
ncbi:MAG: DUF4163 domain-containing protein [Candidatus Uhrbacteria bacterium]|nr:DUF4163 domain-containing protein [Candidatus Uhrbacteria bacterium]MDP3793168.1 DUF4163 domain-containing protein [Candidatus Uhrbacteria bacterium]